jgi:hypothetical protein
MIMGIGKFQEYLAMIIRMNRQFHYYNILNHPIIVAGFVFCLINFNKN